MAEIRLPCKGEIWQESDQYRWLIWDEPELIVDMNRIHLPIELVENLGGQIDRKVGYRLHQFRPPVSAFDGTGRWQLYQGKPNHCAECNGECSQDDYLCEGCRHD